MEIIDNILAVIEEHPHSRSSGILADALASACNGRYGVSMLDISVNLDQKNKDLVLKLSKIAQQPDYSNADQDAALRWLRDNDFLKD